MEVDLHGCERERGEWGIEVWRMRFFTLFFLGANVLVPSVDWWEGVGVSMG